MKPIILITGANGMLARHLASQLEGAYVVRFLTRKVTGRSQYLWDLNKHYIDPEALKDVHSIIHLSGSSITNKRWTAQRKQSILSSRVDSAKLILKELKRHQIHIDSFISASAIGYYGSTTTEAIFNEESAKGRDFLSDVCSQWEEVAEKFKSDQIANRVAIVRTGVILAKNEGILKKMILPIKYGLGSGIGTGNQYVPWIHIQDLSHVFKFLLTNKHISGTFNAVAPEHITNMELTKRMAKVLNRLILMPNIPKFIIQGLFGEMAVIFLEGNRVSSNKIIKHGFIFEYNTLNKALNNLLATNNEE